LCSSAARADERESCEARLGAGGLFIHGSAISSGVSLSYSGASYDDIRLSGACFMDTWGLLVSVEREALHFDGAPGGVHVNSDLWDVLLGPSFRGALGPVELAFGAGYELSTLPGWPTVVSFSPVTRHAVFGQGAASLILPLELKLDLMARVPVAFATEVPGQVTGSSSAWTFGTDLFIPVWKTPRLMGRVGVGYRYEGDHVSGGADTSSQTLHRVLLTFDLALRKQRPEKPVAALVEPPAVQPTTGGIRLRVADAQTGLPLAGAQARIGGVEGLTGGAGELVATDLPPGTVTVEVLQEGYMPDHEAFSVMVGKVLELGVMLRRVHAPAEDVLSGVVHGANGVPLDASLEIVEARLRQRTGPTGKFRLRLPPGSYHLRISAPGYLSQVKDVSLEPDHEAIFNVDLHRRH
jgi:hypothetical protein